jgi:8-oxo-dGTP diphosphatase
VERQYYLPGGGIDPDEGTLAALHRECLEETGWKIHVERRLAAFQAYTFASDLDTWLHQVCHVYLARPVLRLGRPSVDGHEAYWVSVARAVSLLAGSGQRAAVMAAFQRLPAPRRRVVLRRPCPAAGGNSAPTRRT